MTLPAISVRGLGKKYRLGGVEPQRQIREILSEPGSLFRRRSAREEFWALRGVSLDVAEGSVVGVIGRNGAGKSTLLKLLSRITEPTEGEARMYGRTASLLEVGAGFHPELSGRENVFLNGSILGMTRAEIRKRFDEIVAFAEIEKMLDTPVKRYSSGMYVRLAFAVAAHLDPDILLVDEVLAVGDSAFQRKCLGKLEDIGEQGRTVVLVSHSMDTISRLCLSALWLSGGRIRAFGPASSVIGAYLGEGLTHAISWRPTEPADPSFLYHSVSIGRADGIAAGEVLPADVGIVVTFDYSVAGGIPPGRLSFRVDSEDGRTVLTTSHTDATSSSNQPWRPGRTVLQCEIPANLLSPGRYFVTFSEPTMSGNALHEGALSFTVSEQGSLVSRDRRPGIIAPVLDWEETIVP